MTKKLLNHSLIPVSLLAACSAIGQAAAPEGGAIAPVTLEPASGPTLNRFSLGYRMGFNLSTKFKNIGAFSSQSNPNPHDDPNNPGFYLRTYDDGYANEDITHNDHQPGFPNHTWNWGYQNDNQYDSEANTISLHS